MYYVVAQNKNLEAFRSELVKLCLNDETLGAIMRRMQTFCDEAEGELLREVCIELEKENQALSGEYDEEFFDESVATIKESVDLELIVEVIRNIQFINPEAYETLERLWRK